MFACLSLFSPENREVERLVPDAPEKRIFIFASRRWTGSPPRGICCRAGAGGTGFAALRKAAEGQLDPCEDLNELTARLRAVAERRVRTGIVVAQIARTRTLRITSDTPPESRGRVLEEKVVNWIISQARVSERRVSVQELRSTIG